MGNSAHTKLVLVPSLKFNFLPILAAIACATSATAASNEAERNLAIRLFDAKQIEPAAAKFAGIVKNQPGDALSQYYLGVALTRLGRVAEAHGHFQSAYLADPNGLAGRYSKLVLDTEDHPVLNHSNTDESPDDSEISPAQPPVVKNIFTQANERAGLEHEDFLKLSHKTVSRDEEAISTYMDQARSTVSGMMIGGRGRPHYSRGQIEQVEQYYEQQRKTLEQSRNTDLINLETSSAHQASELNKTASSLGLQIKESKSAPGFHLSSIGTNLYVRTYVDSRKISAPPVPELLADQDRLLLVSHHNPFGLTADQDKLLLQRKIRTETLNVKGRLISR